MYDSKLADAIRGVGTDGKQGTNRRADGSNRGPPESGRFGSRWEWTSQWETVSTTLERCRSNDRGQTLQDYLIGISVFLVVVFFVASTVLPSLLAPFESTTGGDEVSQADRVAGTMVQNLSVAGKPNELRITPVEQVVGKDTDALRTRYRLPDTSYVNVSITTLDRTAIVTSSTGTSLASDKQAEGSNAATSARIITLSDGSCDPACRLVVRVW